MYLPHSESEEEEKRSARERGHGAHRLAFIESVFQFEQGYLRFDTSHTASCVALLLRAARGPSGGEDTPASLAQLAHSLIPAFATSDVWRDHPLLHPGVEPMPDAPTALEMGALIYQDLAGLSPTMSVLALEESFMNLMRESPCYGYDMYQAQRVWEVEGEGGGGGGGGGGGEPEERVEHVMVCVGHAGVAIISQAQPLEVQLMVDFADILHFASDGSLFLMNMQDAHSHAAGGSSSSSSSSSDVGALGRVESMVYILSPVADCIAASVERYMKASQAAEALNPGGMRGGAILPVPPRSARMYGAIPVLAQIVLAPRPEWCGLPSSSSSSSGSSSSTEGAGSSASPSRPYPSFRASDAHSTGTLAASPSPLFAAAGTGPADLLPPGWVSAQDSDGDTFYYHTLTKVTTWDHPGRPTGELPEGWCEVADPMDARRYFFCPATRAVTWTRPGKEVGGGGRGGALAPAATPAGASGERGRAGQGVAVGGGAGAGAAAGALLPAVLAPAEQAKQLPQGWNVAYDSSDGTPYYFTSSGRTHWEVPLFPST